jgi:signal transduction histidine kinase/ligand-binding sensor domain-containing protein/DNA-binding response OmpR family regulator
MMVRIFVFILFVYVTLDVRSDVPESITFKHLGVQEGFFQTSILSLYQDENGSIWVSSTNGLSRYNGQLPEEPINILPRQQIKSILGERNGTIFFLHSSNVGTYDIHKETFGYIFSDSLLQNYSLTAMCLNDGVLYAATLKHVLLYKDNKRSVFANLPNIGEVTAMTTDKDGNLYLGTIAKGLYRINKKGGIDCLINTSSKISAVLEDNESNIWVTTRSEGIYVLSTNNATIIRQYKHDSGNHNSLIDNYVRCICKDDDGLLWIGTMYGLDCFEPSTGIFHHYGKSDNSFSSLRNLTVECIMKDMHGSIWLGTYYAGISYFNTKKMTFKSIPIISNDRTWTVIADITTDKAGNIWAGTSDKGLYFYDSKSHKAHFYNVSNSNISGNNIKSLCYDSLRNVLWIGSFMGGIGYYDLNKDNFTHIELGKSEDTEIVHRIQLVGDKLYIATYNGIYVLDVNSLKAVKLTKEARVFDVLLDREQNLYCVTHYNHFKKYERDYNGNYIQVFDSIFSNGAITDMLEDNNGEIWISTTQNGVIHFNRECNKVESFTYSNCGIESDNISSILELSEGEILAGSAVGLSFIDVTNMKSSNFSSVNGFPVVSMQNGSIFKHHDTIFMGGVNSIAACNQLLFSEHRQLSDVKFSRLIVNNRVIVANDDSRILKDALSYTRKITLNYKQTLLKIELSPLDFTNFYPTVYRYKLAGYDEEWYPPTDNGISYMNLPPGNYDLMVKKINAEDYISLHIRVKPPWYASSVAYLLYFLIIVGITALIIRYMDSRRRLSFEIKDKEQKEKITQWKLVFFTNISHEFRTPLTLILGQLDLFTQSPDNTKHRILNSIKHNAERLKFLIDELIDFRKQEQGYLKLKVSRYNFNKLVNEVCLSFIDYAYAHDIRFDFSTVTEVFVWCDRIQMQKVLYNLLSNAFKHTKNEGEIKISVIEAEDKIVVKVRDTGTGIDKSLFETIFQKFYHYDDNSSETGMGIGLSLTKSIVELHKGQIEVESEIGVGSKFTVILQTGNEHFSKEELDEGAKEQKMSASTLLPQPIPSHPADIHISTPSNPHIGQTNFPASAHYHTSTSPHKDRRILIIEDEEALRQLLVSIFSVHYRIEQAANGEEGLAIARKLHPDIIVSDIMMPVMNGLELCRQVKSDFETCHIPIVLLTALTSVEHNLQGLDCGADDYIPKPFNIDILLAKCNTILNNRALLQKRFISESVTPTVNLVKNITTNEMDEKFLAKTLRLIEENINRETLNITFLCRETALSRTSFFAKIKGITGQTPNDLIAGIRLNKAVDLLKHSDLPITEISEQAGFNTIQYFSKSFKDRFGQSPTEFRVGG